MYLLDSDIVIWVLRRDKKITRAVDKLTIDDTVGISTITIAEVYKNAFPEEFAETERLISKQIAFSVDSKVARLAGQYWKKFRPKLEKLSLSDTIIAATAKFQDATLVTLNTKHFPMDDIKVISPS